MTQTIEKLKAEKLKEFSKAFPFLKEPASAPFAELEYFLTQAIQQTAEEVEKVGLEAVNRKTNVCHHVSCPSPKDCCGYCSVDSAHQSLKSRFNEYFGR